MTIKDLLEKINEYTNGDNSVGILPYDVNTDIEVITAEVDETYGDGKTTERKIKIEIEFIREVL